MTRSAIIKTKDCDWCGVTFAKDPRYSNRYFERQRFCCQQCAGNEWKFRAVVTRPDEDVAFVKYVSAPNDSGCTEWTGLQDKDGYGLFAYEGVMHRAHRVALRLSGVEVPKVMMVCHRCDNPLCVNPDHLYVGTGKDNMRDAKERNRLRIGSQNHFAKLNEDTVREILGSATPTTALARKYGVSHGAIHLIRARKTWKHVR